MLLKIRCVLLKGKNIGYLILYLFLPFLGCSKVFIQLLDRIAISGSVHTNRVTRCVCEKDAQNGAQTISCENNNFYRGK
jgi:hypothetical protein